MSLPFVGPSYAIANRKASAQRSVNLYLVGMETASKAPFIMQSVPGEVLFSALGAPIRGFIETGSRGFVVAGPTLYELSADGLATSRGTLGTSSGPVDMAWGVTQLVVVDGPNGYVLTLGSNVFGQITSPNWMGSNRVGYLDGYFVFAKPDSQVFYVSAIDDASDLDALDFASAESSPDNIVSLIVDHREIWLLGQKTTEVWFDAGTPDFPFARNQGAAAEVGCVACFSAQKIDNGIMFLGRDRNGAGIVYRTNGYLPQRASTLAVEEALQASTDISAAVAYVYQMGGQTFYCINAPGVPSTWCYTVAAGTWHECCDVGVSGEFEAHAAEHHGFLLGLHLVGGADGNVYRMDATVNTFNGRPLKRTRISPNDVTPMRDRVQYSRFILDCTSGLAASGVAPQVGLSWSDDGGLTWGDPVLRSTGLIGEYINRVQWDRLGYARDRVWRVDFSDDAPFSIVAGDSR